MEEYLILQMNVSLNSLSETLWFSYNSIWGNRISDHNFAFNVDFSTPFKKIIDSKISEIILLTGWKWLLWQKKTQTENEQSAKDNWKISISYLANA